jgi:hypothetical protein
VDDAPAESHVDDPLVSHDPDATGADDSHEPDETGADDSHEDEEPEDSHDGDESEDSQEGAEPEDSHDWPLFQDPVGPADADESHEDSHDDGDSDGADGASDSGGRPKASQRSCGAMPDEVSPSVGSQRGSVGPSPRLDSCPNR